VSEGNAELRRLAERPEAAAAEAAQVPGVAMVLFRIGSRWCAVRAGDVREIALKGQVSRVPGAPPYVVGVALLRGRLVPVVQLETLLDAEARGEPPSTLPRMIVVSCGEDEVALVAEQAHGVVELVLEAGVAPAGMQAPFVAAELEWRGRMVAVLDPARLMEVVMAEAS